MDAARFATEKAVLRPALPMFLLPGWNGTDMGKMSYSEQLKHPNWQRKRLEVMEAALFQCVNCGDADTTLNVHHRRYVKGRMAWEYESRELECLCQPCHETRHERRELLNELLAHYEMTDELAIGLIAGYMNAALSLDDETMRRCVNVAGESVFNGAVAEIMSPSRRSDWGDVADALLAYVNSKGLELNPAEQGAVDVMHMISGRKKDRPDA